MASVEKVEAFLAEPRTVIVGGVRKDGRAHLSPNWFLWDGQHFYVTTLKSRVKYAIFRREPRAQLLIDDSTGHRAVFVPATVEIREDIRPELPRLRAIRDKYGLATPADEEFLKMYNDEGRILLAIAPESPLSEWTTIGLD
jgi:PPOX class probable F420-dependent enzyme